MRKGLGSTAKREESAFNRKGDLNMTQLKDIQFTAPVITGTPKSGTGATFTLCTADDIRDEQDNPVITSCGYCWKFWGSTCSAESAALLYDSCSGCTGAYFDSVNMQWQFDGVISVAAEACSARSLYDVNASVPNGAYYDPNDYNWHFCGIINEACSATTLYDPMGMMGAYYDSTSGWQFCGTAASANTLCDSINGTGAEYDYSYCGWRFHGNAEGLVASDGGTGAYYDSVYCAWVFTGVANGIYDSTYNVPVSSVCSAEISNLPAGARVFYYCGGA